MARENKRKRDERRFKTWTTSYMGRPLDKPVICWIPSHVKGSGDNGVIISDYKVKAPSTPG